MDDVRLYEMYLNEAIEERKTDLLNRNIEYINYEVELSDTYDFTEFSTDYLQKGIFNAIAWIGNDLAYLDMNAGALNDYHLTIRVAGVLP